MSVSRRRLFGALVAVGLLFPFSCARPQPVVPDTPEMQNLRRLAEVFYSRISNRRFNSISTFHDPALREFFKSPEEFSDYYADLADALASANFEYNRPNSVWIAGMEEDEEGRVRIEVLFTGENAKPLRWWRTRVGRLDRWELSDGRWWVVPGKL